MFWEISSQCTKGVLLYCRRKREYCSENLVAESGDYITINQDNSQRRELSGTFSFYLTHWGRVTQICVGKLIIIGSDNGLSPGRRQAIIWTNAGILLIGSLGTNFSEISIKMLTFSFTKMRLKVSSAKWRPFCLGLNVLKHHKGTCLI